MRAYEQKKNKHLMYDDKPDRSGIIWMVVEGDEAEVVTVCAKLDKLYKNDTCPNDAPYSEGYFIDRHEKQEFMAAYKVAKKSIA